MKISTKLVDFIFIPINPSSEPIITRAFDEQNDVPFSRPIVNEDNRLASNEIRLLKCNSLSSTRRRKKEEKTANDELNGSERRRRRLAAEATYLASTKKLQFSLFCFFLFSDEQE
jgi:hypothetical protein